jgi:hypothetical protein
MEKSKIEITIELNRNLPESSIRGAIKDMVKDFNGVNSNLINLLKIEFQSSGE